MTKSGFDLNIVDLNMVSVKYSQVSTSNKIPENRHDLGLLGGCNEVVGSNLYLT